MYRTYLTLDSFIRAARRRHGNGGMVYVQHLQASQKLHGVIDAITSTVVVTALTHEAGEPIILVGRIVVEAAQIYPDQVGAHTALNARSVQAAELVCAALERAGLSVESGILLQPGMYDDLARFHTDHELWRFGGESRDVERRRLLPSAQPA